MTIEPVDKYFGISLSEWIERTPNELEQDAVGLWQIVSVGQENFDLDRKMLREFVRRSVVALVRKGAVPALPSSGENKFWERQDKYGYDPEEIATNIVSEWQRPEKDPDENGLWFSLMD